MRENEFEKRVQKKMDELDLHPSAAVWIEVEKRIRKEKKRRIIFWWPLLFLLITMGIGAAFWMRGSHRQPPALVSEKNEAPRSRTGKNRTPAQVKAFTQPNQLLQSKEGRQTLAVKEKPANSEADRHSAGIKQSIFIKEKAAIRASPVVQTIVHTNKEKIKTGTSDADEDIQQTTALAKEIIPRDNRESKNTATTDSAVVVAPVKSDQMPEIKAEKIITQYADSTFIAKNDTAKAMRNRKWEKGIDVSIGQSSMVKGFGIFGEKYFADQSNPQNSSGGGLPGTVSASLLHPSVSFAAGVFVKKNISNKLAIQLGAGYQYYATKMDIGNRVDSARTINYSSSGFLSVDQFYRAVSPDSGKMHSNQFHFAGLQATLAWKVLDHKKLKLYWENGLQYSRLLGTTLLLYDRSLPGYYKNNSQVKKDIISLTSGFSAPVAKRWYLNPFLTYSLTSLMKENHSAPGNLTNYGLKIKFLLNKRN